METALIIPVPEAEAAVARHRSVLDSSAAHGVPAHVTILYPFLKPPDITATVLEILSQAIGSQRAFTATFTSVQWFGDTVAWLKPEPAQPFRDLTLAVCDAFPGWQPYNGEHDDVIPHLTIGHDHPRLVLEMAAAEIAAALPVTASITHVRLMARTEAQWFTLCDFPLAQ